MKVKSKKEKVKKDSRLLTFAFLLFNRCASNSPQLAAQELFHYRSPSFPHAFSGNPGENGTGPPIKTFGGDAFGINSHQYSLTPRSLLRGSSFVFLRALRVLRGGYSST
jgi:hypothetical protein